jgi:aspartyl-tRNA(Asn)/glutamyl-tRNA(Gln) amidotransferase subunit C
MISSRAPQAASAKSPIINHQFPMPSPALDVRYIAQLARINLTEAEIATFQSQLDHVIQYVEQLKQDDVSGVEPTAHASPVFNVFRPDVPRDCFDAATALSNAPRQVNGLFSVTKVIE